MKTTGIIAAAVVVAAAGAAQADTIDVRYLGTGAGSSVRITNNGSSRNLFAGQLRHTLTNGTGLGATLHGTWVTFCTDLNQSVTSTTRTYDVVDVAQVPNWGPMGIARANAIRDMYAYANGSQLVPGSATNALATAFQLAVWEIVTDFNPSVGVASLSLSSGGFRATRTNGSSLSSAVMGHVNALFGSIGAAPTGGNVSILGIRSATAQDQIVPIPAPGAFALTSLGCVCLAGRRRR